MALQSLLFSLRTRIPPRIPCLCYHTSSVYYAKLAPKAKGLAGKGGKQMQTAAKVVLNVETDPEKLLTKCCGANIYVDGQDPEIKPNSEYPDWLWTLRTERSAPDIEEIEPNSRYYWARLKKMTLRRNNELRKLSKFNIK